MTLYNVSHKSRSHTIRKQQITAASSSLVDQRPDSKGPGMSAGSCFVSSLLALNAIPSFLWNLGTPFRLSRIFCSVYTSSSSVVRGPIHDWGRATTDSFRLGNSLSRSIASHASILSVFLMIPSSSSRTSLIPSLLAHTHTVLECHLVFVGVGVH